MRVSASIELLWQLAGQEATAAEFGQIEPEHFFVAVLKLAELPVKEAADFAHGANVARELAAEVNAIRQELMSRSIDSTRVRRALRAHLGRGTVPCVGGEQHRSQASKDLFDAAARVANNANAKVIGPQHLLRALLAAPTPAMQKVLGEAVGPKADKRSETPLLDEWGKDLVQMARKDQLDKGSQRPAECKALMHLLADTGRRSVVIVTENDRTARSIVVELAHAIADRQCPAEIEGKRIIDLTAIKRHKNSRMERMERLLSEAATGNEVILVVPPIEATSDPSEPSVWVEMLKNATNPASPQWICRATLAGYERWIGKDRDWKRHVQVMWVKETDTDSIPWEF